ncbi:MAG: hypothetical protein WD928_06715 [Gammaproteobacteria bacterium]
MDINIGISAQDRESIAAGLSRLLADSYTLYLNLLTQRMQIHEKNAWMLRSLLAAA